MVTRDGLYWIGSYGSVVNLNAMKLRREHGPNVNVKARWTGEKRPPRKGEYFLSGACVQAWEAYTDMNVPYHIAELVVVESRTTTTVRVVRVL